MQEIFFLQLKLETCVIPLFHEILSKKSIYGIILVIENHLQGRKIIFKVEKKIAARYFKVKYDFLTNEARNKCKTVFHVILTRKSISSIICRPMTQSHIQG